MERAAETKGGENKTNGEECTKGNEAKRKGATERSMITMIMCYCKCSPDLKQTAAIFLDSFCIVLVFWGILSQ